MILMIIITAWIAASIMAAPLIGGMIRLADLRAQHERGEL